MHELILDRKSFLFGATALTLFCLTDCRGYTGHSNSMAPDEQYTVLNSMDIQYNPSTADWNGWIVTPDEKKSLVKAGNNQKARVEYLEGTDLPGDDLLQTTAANAEECGEICSEQEVCEAFTYAKPSHPNPAKKNKCFLKKKQVQNVTKDDNYTSGYIFR